MVVFCTGFTVHFIMVATFLLWFIHLAYVAILCKFPFFGKRLMKRAGLVHAVSVPTALLFCLIGPTVTLLWCGYFTARFPIILCVPSNIDVLFYSIAVPLNILAVLCVPITLAAAWEIHKVRVHTYKLHIRRHTVHNTCMYAYIHVSTVICYIHIHVHSCTYDVVCMHHPMSLHSASQLGYIRTYICYWPL